MVQRKVHDQKLGIQAEDPHKKNKFLKSSSSSSYSQSGAELKKLMKKSGSFKRSEGAAVTVMASSSSSSLRASRRSANPRSENPSKTPQKLKIFNGSSPNYMKSTSSSTARKGGLQVSHPNGSSKSGFDLKSVGRIKRIENRPKISYGSVKNLTKSCSLKPVRTLAKISSMKKKSCCCRVGLCSNQNVGRATCSSTLKDSKFPPYVVLSPGGTEAEGTSVMKVCPYTYCSLNGHHHEELPPLKRFLSAKRRSMKTQKAGRLKSLTPLGIKPCGEERNKDIDTGQTVLVENNLDFFVQIYAPAREENGVESLDKLAHDRNDETEEEKMGTVVDLQDFKDGSFSVEEDEETKRNNGGGEDEISLDELSCSELSFEDDLDQNCDLVEEETEDMQKEGVDESSATFVQADMDFEGYSFVDDMSFEGPVMSELEESKSEISNMDWEDEQYVASLMDNGADNFPVTDDETDSDLEENGEENNGVLDQVSLDGCDSEVHENGQILEIDLSGELPSDVFGEPTSTKEANDEDAKTLVLEEPAAYNEEICEAYELNVEYMEQVCSSLEDEPKMDESTADEQTEHQVHGLENVGDEAAGEEIVEVADHLLETENCGSCQMPSDTVEDSFSKSKCEVKDKSISSSTYVKEQNDMEGFNLKSFEKDDHVIDGKEMEAEKGVDAGAKDMTVTAHEVISAEEKNARTNAKCGLGEELLKNSTDSYKPNRIRRPNEDSEELRKLNWQEPHFLPMDPDLESEKVDLKHQMMEERKNAEEWMLDYALRQTVNKLAPARKKKVALLVEAFEMVVPLPKWENRSLQHATTPFGHTRFVQACN
ncbi:hypothetical protein Syun_017695 [Stephania yunnanensis]|uniref:Calmodulin-binding domain-containing protein n=1 Tax=Stephania yunnanensis TaxID=152371 RepID=A0AAP0J9P3_9MAGN